MDAILGIILLYAAWKGWKKGLVMAIFSLAAMFLGIMAAVKLSATAAVYVQEHTEWRGGWLPMVSFMALMVVVVLLVTLAGKAIEAALGLTLLGPANKIAGAVLYVMLYAFLISVLLFYATGAGWVNVEGTWLAEKLLPLGPRIVEWVGERAPLFRDVIRELEQYFENFSYFETANR